MARELCEAACQRLLPQHPIAAQAIEDLNDTSIGYVTIIQLFDEHLDRDVNRHVT